MKILVIGDSCDDVFRYGEVNRIAPEAPVAIIKPERETTNPGMAGNVSINLQALGAEVDFITNKTKIRKIRYVCSKYNHMLLRVDENDKCEKVNIDFKSFNFSSYDAVVISDYCKGFLDIKDIYEISTNCSAPVFLDTKKELGGWATCVDFIKINSVEFEASKNIIEESLSLQKRTIVTRGKFGCDYKGVNYPTEEVAVKDVSGAGDTFLSGLVVEYIKTKNISKAIEFAQVCTTKVVQKKGVSTV